MYSQGRVIPQIWMNNSVGNDISIEPLLEAVRKALGKKEEGVRGEE